MLKKWLTYYTNFIEYTYLPLHRTAHPHIEERHRGIVRHRPVTNPGDTGNVWHLRPFTYLQASPGNDGAKHDGPGNDGPRNDGPEHDGPGNDGLGHDSPGNDGPRNDGSPFHIFLKNYYNRLF